MKLGKINFDLLCVGVKMEGSWIGAFNYAFESLYLYANEIDTIRNFCIWLDENNLGMGYANYEDRFKQFKEVK